MADTIFGWLKEWGFWVACLTLIGATITTAVAARRFIIDKRQQGFENYHRLIERINRPLQGTGEMFLDIQLAAIYELRHYRRYRLLSIFLLKKSWVGKPKYKTVVKNTIDKLENRKTKKL